MKKHAMVIAVIVALLVGTDAGRSQQWSLGGNVGLSLLGGAAGFHITPVAEMLFNRSMSIGTEFSINSQYGAPLIWYPYFKYYFNIPGSSVKPYANAGPVLTLNVPNAPCFGILFGGGVNIPIAHKLYITPDFQLGPVFGYGGATYPFILSGNYWGYQTYGLTSYSIPSETVFTFSIRGGIRYEL
jgi:hypothetical protein